MIPVGVSDKLVEDYNNEVNKTISEYSVYENKEEWITDVPVGLQYATLNLENIDILEHTKFVVEAYEAGKHDKKLKTIDEFDGAIAQKNTKLDLPIQDIVESRPDYKEETIDIKIKVVSEGQVNDDQNGGISITRTVTYTATVKEVDSVK